MAVRSSAITAYSDAVRAVDVSRLARPTTSSYNASTSAATRSHVYLRAARASPAPAHALRGVGVVQQSADRARHVGRVERRDQPGPGLGDLPVDVRLGPISTTGVPDAIASTTAMPKHASWRDGSTNTSAALSSRHLSSPTTIPVNTVLSERPCRS